MPARFLLPTVHSCITMDEIQVVCKCNCECILWVCAKYTLLFKFLLSILWFRILMSGVDPPQHSTMSVMSVWIYGRCMLWLFVQNSKAHVRKIRRTSLALVASPLACRADLGWVCLWRKNMIRMRRNDRTIYGMYAEKWLYYGMYAEKWLYGVYYGIYADKWLYGEMTVLWYGQVTVRRNDCTMVCIRESVDPLCRDATDTHIV